ncbi:D-aminopeptidase [Candidatus Hepatincola sp. Av]
MNSSTCMRVSYFIVLLFIFCFSSYQLLAAISLLPALNQIDELAQAKIKEKKTAGMQVAVLYHGAVIYNKSFGYMAYYNKGKLIKKKEVLGENNIFDLASLTKVVATTQAIMMLNYEERLSLEDRVAKYIPEFAVNGKENITIYNLLTHTSGLPAWEPLYLHNKNSKDVILYISSLPLEYETGSKSIYSDLGFIILGEVVARITNMPLDVYTEKYIFSPLNMVDTMYNLPHNLTSRAVPTDWQNLYEQHLINDHILYKGKAKATDFKDWRNVTLQGEVEDGNAYYAMQGVSGHAGIFSTMNDLLIWGKMILGGGSYNGNLLYSKEVRDIYLTPQASGRAIGFDSNKSYMGNNRPAKTLGHTGFTGNCVALNIPKDIMIIILSNKVNIPMVNFKYTSPKELCTDIMDTVWTTLIP